MKGIGFDIIIILLLIGIGLAGGYMLGKSSFKMEEKTVVEYRTLPAIHVEVAPKPFNISIPEVPIFLYLTDTITGIQVIDTAAIVADWILQREYTGRLIDDSTGTVDYSATVQYNRLQRISLDYIHFQRTEVTTKTQVVKPRWAITAGVGLGCTPSGFQPFAGVSFGYIIWSK